MTNPTLMGWLTIIGLPLGLYSLYLTFAFNKEVKPVYKVLSDVIVTQRSSNSKIKVYYDSVEVQNVRATTITIWNAGNEYLDKGAFSLDKPLSIRSVVPVRILEVKALVTTRPDLKFVSSLHTYKAPVVQKSKLTTINDYITLQIKGDEGLESQDGATFLILYTSSVNGNWYIDARIKGVPKGIQRASGPAKDFSFLEIVMFIFIIPNFYMLYIQGRHGKRSKSDIFLLIFYALTICFILYRTINNIYYITTAVAPPEGLIK